MKRFNSIKKNRRFRDVYQKGCSRASGSLVMYIADNDLGINRLGISAGKKIGNSVVRHTFSRRIREIFRLNNYRTVQSKDIIVVARSRAGQALYKSLETDYLRLLRAHNLLLDADESGVSDLSR